MAGDSSLRASKRPEPGEIEAASSALRAQPLSFIANAGQWRSELRFAVRTASWTAGLARDGWWLALRRPAAECENGWAGAALRWRFEGARADAEPAGEWSLPTRYNFFIGSDSARWASDVESFAAVRYAELYPGVDVLVHDGGGALEYDLELGDGADASQIAVTCEGAFALELEPDGSLSVHTPAGILRQSPPRALILSAGLDARAVECRFRILDTDRFGFEVPVLSPGERLAIDPALVWSTYLGASSESAVHGLASGANGRAFVAGDTDGFDFPIVPGAWDPFWNGGLDAFVSALDNHATLLSWSTFLGGTKLDELIGLAVDASGAPIVAGDTLSTNFPTTSGAYDASPNGLYDVFVTQLSSTGSALLFSTYLGGTNNDVAAALALEPSGSVLVAGSTASFGFPTTPGAFSSSFSGGPGSDGFVARLDATGSQLLLGTYFGGFGDDAITSLALSPTGEIAVGGSTTSFSFPTSPGAYSFQIAGGRDAFASRLDPTGSQLLASTLVGGVNDEQCNAIAVDANGAMSFAGWTDSPSFPTTPGALATPLAGIRDAFVVRLTPNASALTFSTALGGNGTDEVAAMALESSGDLLLVGHTDSDDFPTTPGAYDRTFNSMVGGGESDGFVARLRGDGAALLYSSFFGATNDDRVLALDVTPSGALLIGGRTSSFLFPTTAGVVVPSLNVLATGSGFVAELALLVHPIPYGLGKINSFGGEARLYWSGFPSVADNDFELVFDGGIPNQPAVCFFAATPWDVPFLGGRLYVHPPIHRGPKFPLDFVGYGTGRMALPVGWIGTTLYFQAWSKDPLDPQGVALTNGLQVLVHP